MSILEPTSHDVTKWREDAALSVHEPRPSPEHELVGDLFNIAQFVCLLVLIFAVLSVVWSVLQQFYPDKHCMILQVFNFKCKE